MSFKFFRTANLFHVLNFDVTVEQLEESMREKLFRECEANEPSQVGWIPALGKDTQMMTRSANGCILMTLKSEERKVPGKALKNQTEIECKEEFQRRVEAGVEAPNLSKEDIQEIRERVEHRMLLELPKAFSNYKETSAYIDTRNKWLIVDAGSRNVAEGVAQFIRNTVNEIPGVKDRMMAIPAIPKDEPSQIMSTWLEEGNVAIDTESGLTWGDQCTLRGLSDSKNVIKYKHQAFDDENLLGHLDGMTVVDMLINFEDRLAMTLVEDFQIKGIKLNSVQKQFLNGETSQLDDEHNDLEYATFDIYFQHMTEQFEFIIPVLATLMGELPTEEELLENNSAPESFDDE